MRAVVALALLAGCLDAIAPDVGPPAMAAGDGATCDTDSDPRTAVTFAAQIAPILADACRRCHNPDGEGFQNSGLDLSTYDSLRAGGTRSVGTIVVPGEPCASVLFQKIGEAPPFGSRMPRGDAPLPAAEQLLIHDWIAEGALDN